MEKEFKIRNRIKELRKKNNIKQIVLADMLNVSQSNISHWERQCCQPKKAEIKKMCEIFNCDAYYLMGISEEDIKKEESPKEDFPNKSIIVIEDNEQTIYNLSEDKFRAIKALLDTEK